MITALLVLIVLALLLVAVALVSPEAAGLVIVGCLYAAWYAFCFAVFGAMLFGLIILAR